MQLLLFLFLVDYEYTLESFCKTVNLVVHKTRTTNKRERERERERFI